MSPAKSAPMAPIETPSEKRAVVAAAQVSHGYRSARTVLDQVSLEAEPGVFTAVLGTNGSGKSTLLSCMDGLLKPQEGTVLVGETPIDRISRGARARTIALVEQQSILPKTTVYDALMLGRLPYVRYAPDAEDRRIVEEVAGQLGIGDLLPRRADHLSGGEAQKVAIARTLVQRTPVLLLDEPLNNLDVANQLECMALVRKEIDRRNIAAIAVMHDINLALRFCNRFAFMKDGRLLFFGSADIIDADLIETVYGIEADVIQHAGRKVVIPC